MRVEQDLMPASSYQTDIQAMGDASQNGARGVGTGDPGPPGR
jgi:hypothetical protein